MTPVPAKKTSTNLFAFPDSVKVGDYVVLFAVVSPYEAEGTVQFKNGSANIGGPQRTFFGFAVQFTAFSSPGEYKLTAVFTPDNPTKYQPSTSNTQIVRVRR